MYTEDELAAIRHAQEILQQAGLHSSDIFADPGSEHRSPTSFIPLINYVSPEAALFTQDELENGQGFLTRVRKSAIDSIVDHPLGAIVEFPETGTRMNMSIAHRFKIDPENFVNPKDNIQYSLGGKHSIHYNVVCLRLHDKDTGNAVSCTQTKISCCSTKKCSFTPVIMQHTLDPVSLDASGEVFMKTLAFFCALKGHNCSFPRGQGNEEITGGDNEEEELCSLGVDPMIDLVAILKDSRFPEKATIPKCSGKLLLKKDEYGHYFMGCEYYAKEDRNHFRLRNLNEMDIDYLGALLDNRTDCILSYEIAAASHGYGPLVPCNIMESARGQKQLCPMWHRNSKGILHRGLMIFTNECQCRFEIYQPNDLVQCPYILIVSRNPHSHSDPPRTKAPQSIKQIFRSLLEPLGWRLADATPRRLLLENTFIHGLRQVLSWTDFRDPGLGDLHPAFVNYDYAARLIDKLRYEHYPEGTGIEGAQHLFQKHLALPPEEQYIRCVETFEYPKEGKFQIIVCMFQAMSHLLLKTKRPSIDTSFKRLHNWQEFEIEAWFPEYSRSIVVARAFTTSQTALAHQTLFRIIFNIVKSDTGKAVQFRHIHGSGCDTITADGHRGQALGLGLYLQEICQTMREEWSSEWNKPLYALTPTEHLACFYRYCFAHYTRNVNKLRGRVTQKVLSAMMSLASADPLPNYDHVLSVIRSGGKKALDWLKDKEANDAFTLAAVYQPLSKIPRELWKAAPSTSNGNEQAHRNINRDGINLTMLAGIMRGLQFDYRAMKSTEFWLTESVQPRDKLATHFHRSARAIRFKATVQQRIIKGKDVEIQTKYEKVKELQKELVSTTASVKHSSSPSKTPTRAQKRRRNCEEKLEETRKQLEVLIPQGSGAISLHQVKKEEALHQKNLLECKSELEFTPANTYTHTMPAPTTTPGPFEERQHLYPPLLHYIHDPQFQFDNLYHYPLQHPSYPDSASFDLGQSFH